MSFKTTQQNNDTKNILRASQTDPSSSSTVSLSTSSRCMKLSLLLLILTYAGGLALAITVLYYISTSDVSGPVFAWSIAGIFVGGAIPLSLHDVHMHLQHYISPLQRHYIRILWMVPIYAIESWLSLRYKDSNVYLQITREAYEAYVLYAFSSLMIEFCGGKKRLSAKLRLRATKESRERVKHLPPCSWCCRGWRLGSRFVHRSMIGVYQYVLLRVICTIMILIGEATHHYHEEWSNPIYVITTIVINISQCYALYILALFYLEMRKDLRPLSPLGKFTVVKAVVFFSFWQGIAVSGAVALGLVPTAEGYTQEEVAKGIQDFAICVEMFIAAIAHTFYYSYRDVMPGKDGSPSPILVMQQLDAEFDRENNELQLKEKQTQAHHINVPSTSTSSNHHDNNNGSNPNGLSTIPHHHTTTTTTTPANYAKHAAHTNDDDDDEEYDIQEIDTSQLAVNVTPMGVKAAVMDMLPGDVLHETYENVTTGFGVLHKIEKRKKQRRAALHDWANKQWDDLTGQANPNTNTNTTTSTGSGDNNGTGSTHHEATKDSSTQPTSIYHTPSKAVTGGFVPPTVGMTPVDPLTLSMRTKKRSERVMTMTKE